MTKELIDKLTQEPGPHSAYIEDSELRDMAIAWAVEVRNAFELAPKEEHLALNKKYISLLENMDPALAKRFNGYLRDTLFNGTILAEWSQPAERIRKTLLPK